MLILNKGSQVNVPNITIVRESPEKRARSPIDEATRRKRCKVSEAVAVLAPQFSTGEDVHAVEWSTGTPRIAKTTAYRDKKELRAVLFTISRGDPRRAANAISNLLSEPNNDDVQKLLPRLVPDDIQNDTIQKLAKYDLIVGGIRDSIERHTNGRGTRTIAAETFVKNVTQACLTRIVATGEKISSREISRLIGANINQVSTCRDSVASLVVENGIITTHERKKRKDFIRQKLRPYVFDFLLDDSYTRLDTNQGMLEVTDPRTNEERMVHRRIWLIVNKKGQHVLFLASDHYRNFQDENAGATVGYTIFTDARTAVGQFVSNPRKQSCVDEIISGLEHYTVALLQVFRWERVRRKLEHYVDSSMCNGGLTFNGALQVLRKAGAYQLIQKLCCPKEKQRQLFVDQTKDCPKLVPFRCTHGTDGKGKGMCSQCGITKKLSILQAILKLPASDDLVEVMVWGEGIRSGEKKGKQNTQRELLPIDMTVRQLICDFTKHIQTCIPHYQDISWIRLTISNHFAWLPPGYILVFTDFSAVMDLRARDTVNCAIDGHAVCDNFIVISNRRTVPVEKEKKKGEVNIGETEHDDIEIATVDVHHFFAATIERGKKNDHAMHIVCLEALIEKYKTIFRNKNMVLKQVLVWTDNAPNQYRCRQNFVNVVSVTERHELLRLVHFLAIKMNFKGPHDGYGKEASAMVRMLELIGVRSETAFKVFKNCFDYLQRTEEDTKWKEYEQTANRLLKNKGAWGMDSRNVYFVTESKEEFGRESQRYPGRILLCDRTKMKDTQNQQSLDDTNECHELRSVATTVPTTDPKVWPAQQADLPCALCPACREDPVNTTCPYATWRNSRRVEVIEQGEDTELADFSPSALSKLTVPELSRRCKAKRLPHTGRKADLVKRLADAMGGVDPVPPAAAAPTVAVAPPVAEGTTPPAPLIVEQVPQRDGREDTV